MRLVVSARRCRSLIAAGVILGGMTLAVPGSTGFVALAQRAVIGMTVRPVGHDSTSRRPNVNRREGVAGSRRPSLRAPGCAVERTCQRTCHCGAHAAYQPIQAVRPMFAVQTGTPTDVRAH